MKSNDQSQTKSNTYHLREHVFRIMYDFFTKFSYLVSSLATSMKGSNLIRKKKKEKKMKKMTTDTKNLPNYDLN